MIIRRTKNTFSLAPPLVIRNSLAPDYPLNHRRLIFTLFHAPDCFFLVVVSAFSWWRNCYFVFPNLYIMSSTILRCCSRYNWRILKLFLLPASLMTNALSQRKPKKSTLCNCFLKALNTLSLTIPRIRHIRQLLVCSGMLISRTISRMTVADRWPPKALEEKELCLKSKFCVKKKKKICWAQICETQSRSPCRWLSARIL